MDGGSYPSSNLSGPVAGNAAFVAALAQWVGNSLAAIVATVLLFVLNHPFWIIAACAAIAFRRVTGIRVHVMRFIFFFIGTLADGIFRNCFSAVRDSPVGAHLNLWWIWIASFVSVCLLPFRLIGSLANCVACIPRLRVAWSRLRSYAIGAYQYVSGLPYRVYALVLAGLVGFAALVWYARAEPEEYVQEAKPSEPIDPEAPKRFGYRLPQFLRIARNFLVLATAGVGLYDGVVEIYRFVSVLITVAEAGSGVSATVAGMRASAAATPLSGGLLRPDTPASGRGGLGSADQPVGADMSFLDSTLSMDSASSVPNASAAAPPPLTDPSGNWPNSSGKSSSGFGAYLLELKATVHPFVKFCDLIRSFWGWVCRNWLFVPVLLITSAVLYLCYLFEQRIAVLEEKERTRYEPLRVAYEARSKPAPIVASIAPGAPETATPVPAPLAATPPSVASSPVAITLASPAIFVPIPVLDEAKKVEEKAKEKEVVVEAKKAPLEEPDGVTTVTTPDGAVYKVRLNFTDDECRVMASSIIADLEEKHPIHQESATRMTILRMTDYLCETEEVYMQESCAQMCQECGKELLPAQKALIATEVRKGRREGYEAEAGKRRGRQGKGDYPPSQDTADNKAEQWAAQFQNPDDRDDDKQRRREDTARHDALAEKAENQRERNARAQSAMERGEEQRAEPSERDKKKGRHHQEQKAGDPVVLPMAPIKSSIKHHAAPVAPVSQEPPVVVPIETPEMDFPIEEAKSAVPQATRIACRAVGATRKDHGARRDSYWWAIADRCSVCDPLSEAEKTLVQKPKEEKFDRQKHIPIVKSRKYRTEAPKPLVAPALPVPDVPVLPSPAAATPKVLVLQSSGKAEVKPLVVSTPEQIIKEAKTANPRFMLPVHSIFDISTEKKIATGFFSYNSVVTAAHVVLEGSEGKLELVDAVMEWPPGSGTTHKLRKDLWVRHLYKDGDKSFELDIVSAPLPASLTQGLSDKSIQLAPVHLKQCPGPDSVKFVKDNADVAIVGRLEGKFTVSTGKIAGTMLSAGICVFKYDSTTDYGDSGAPVITTDGRVIGVHSGGVRGQKLNAFTWFGRPITCNSDAGNSTTPTTVPTRSA